MKYKVLFTKKAVKSLNKLGKDVKNNINKALRKMLNHYEESESPYSGLKLLKGKYKGLARLRVGDYRIIFKMEKKGTILVLDVLHRQNLY